MTPARNSDVVKNISLAMRQRGDYCMDDVTIILMQLEVTSVT